MQVATLARCIECIPGFLLLAEQVLVGYPGRQYPPHVTVAMIATCDVLRPVPLFGIIANSRRVVTCNVGETARSEVPNQRTETRRPQSLVNL